MKQVIGSIISAALLLISTNAFAVPTVNTQPARDITTSSAVLFAAVNPNGGSGTTVTFEYGTSSGSYGDPVTATYNPITNNSPSIAYASISGLDPNQTYYFRAVAINDGDSSPTSGAELNFKTLGLAPEVTTQSATDLTASSATLNGLVNPNNDATTVVFEYGNSTAYGQTANAVQNPFTGSTSQAASVGISNLKPDTKYFFRVKANNSTDETIGGNLTFTTSPAAPTVEPQEAEAVTDTTATLLAIVNPNGLPTNVTFEYGPTTSYGTTVEAENNPITGGRKAASVSLTGLLPNRTYHFRATATNTVGSVTGPDGTFTTNAAAPTASIAAAENVSATGAVLKGTVNARGTPTTVTFHYGDSPNFGQTITATPSLVTGASDQPVSATLGGLTPSSPYYYRIEVESSAGQNFSSSTSFTTLSSRPNVTAQPAENITPTTAKLNAIVNPNGLETRVDFEYGPTNQFGTKIAAENNPLTGASQQAFATLRDLEPNRLYYYRALATNSQGQTTGGTSTFTTAQVPPTVTTQAATSVTDNRAVLNGAVNPNNLPTTVVFEYGENYASQVAATTNPATNATPQAVSATLTGLQSNTTYNYRIRATNAKGTNTGLPFAFTTSSATMNVTTTPIAEPPDEITETTAKLRGEVELTGVNGATLSRAGFCYGTRANPNINGSCVTIIGPSASSVSFTGTLTNLFPGTLYHVMAFGENNSGAKSYGADLTFTTDPDSSATAPSVEILAADNVTDNSARLNGRVNANGAQTEVKFEYGTSTSYGTTVSADQSLLAGSREPQSVTVDIDGTLFGGITYHFRVCARNSVSDPAFICSADSTFTTPALIFSIPAAKTLDATSVTSTTATLNGEVDPKDLSTNISFRLGTTDGGPWNTRVTATPSALDAGAGSQAVSAAIVDLMPGTTYYYVVYALNAKGASMTGAQKVFTTDAEAPRPPTAELLPVTDVSLSGAILKGVVNPNNSATTAHFEYSTDTAYNNKTTSQSLSGSGNQPISAAISGLTPATTYNYRISAENSKGAIVSSSGTFTTPEERAPEAITKAATRITETSGVLNGEVNPYGEATTVTFEYGPAANTYDSFITADQSQLSGTGLQAVSVVLSGLTEGQTVHYRVKAESAQGTTYGENVSFIAQKRMFMPGIIMLLLDTED